MPKVKYKLFAVFGTLAFVALAAVPVLAVGSDNSNGTNASQGSTSSGSGSDNAQGESKKLQGENLTKCLNKEGQINQVMQRITNRAELQYNLFGTIAERVQNYYTENGLHLTNYDELVTAIEAARERAQTSFQAMESNGGAFNCNSDDPHAYANQFTIRVDTGVDDLQTYKTAVRALVVAVQTAAEEVANE